MTGVFMCVINIFLKGIKKKDNDNNFDKK